MISRVIGSEWQAVSYQHAITGTDSTQILALEFCFTLFFYLLAWKFLMS